MAEPTRSDDAAPPPRAASRDRRRRPSARVYRRRRRVAATAMVAAISLPAMALEEALSGPIPVVLDAQPVAGPPAPCGGASATALRRQLGARLVVRMESTATPQLKRQARRGEIGGVVLFPGTAPDPAVLRREIAELQEAADAATDLPLLISVDQEGGEVKRLPEAPPTLSPAQIAGSGRPSSPRTTADAVSVARAQGRATGEELAELGINVDLAPVLDVPEGPGSFIASRAFGAGPARVGALGGAFAQGLADADVGAAAKHFPGLGRATANTDLAPTSVTATEQALRTDLEPFRQAIGDGIPLVMLSSAIYPALDRRAPAFASSRISDGLLRGELAFGGATITDDLGAAAVTARYDPRAAAGAAAAGGSDLLLFARTSAPDVLDGLVRDARRGAIGAEALEASCVRVHALRTSLSG